MTFLVNRKLATRIGIITTCITLAGMLLLWRTVSDRGSDIVKNDITNQMTDAVEARAAIINDYVSSAEEYMTAFALGKEGRAAEYGDHGQRLSGNHPPDQNGRRHPGGHLHL